MIVEIFNHEDDGYQIIYIDKVLWIAIHFNDDLFGYTVVSLLKMLGHECKWLFHDDIPCEYRQELLEKGFIDNE